MVALLLVKQKYKISTVYQGGGTWFPITVI